MGIQFLLNDLILWGITSFVIIKFLKKTFRAIYENTVYYMMIILFAFLGIYSSFYEYSFLWLIFSVLGYFLIGYIGFDCSVKKLIYHTLFFFLYLMCIHFSGQFLCLVLPNINENYISYNQKELLLTLAKPILIIFTYKIYMKAILRYKIEKLESQHFFMMLLFCVFQLFLLSTILSDVSTTKKAFYFSIILIALLIFDMYFSYIFSLLSNKIEQERILSYEREQTKTMIDQYNEMERKFENTKKFLHDANQHLIILEQLYKKENFQLSIGYKEEFQKNLSNVEKLIFSCQNKVLTILINDLADKCSENKIRLWLNIDNQIKCVLSDYETTIVFSNIFKNAFEASCEVQEKERFIDITIINFNDQCLATVKNQCKNTVKQFSQQYSSTKVGHYGVGLINVRKVIEKYGGVLVTDQKNRIFTVSINIPN